MSFPSCYHQRVGFFEIFENGALTGDSVGVSTSEGNSEGESEGDCDSEGDDEGDPDGIMAKQANTSSISSCVRDREINLAKAMLISRTAQS